MKSRIDLDGSIARTRVVLTANYFIAAMSFLTSYINFKIGEPQVLSWVQAGVFCLCCYVAIKTHRVGLSHTYTLATSVCYMSLVIYATYISDLNSGIAVWGMTLPILFYFIW